MAKYKHGYYTGDLEIDPYLMRKEVWEDCEAGLIPDLFRRAGSKRGYYIIPRQQVEPYFKRKGLPDDIIEDKLKSLGIMSNDQKKELLTQVLQGSATVQLSVLDRISHA